MQVAVVVLSERVRRAQVVQEVVATLAQQVHHMVQDLQEPQIQVEAEVVVLDLMPVAQVDLA
jgi:hypothetical protein